MKRTRKLSLIIALLFAFFITAGVYATQKTTLFTRIADVIVCTIQKPHGTASNDLPESRCVTNDGNSITIIHEREDSYIEDKIIPLP